MFHVSLFRPAAATVSCSIWNDSKVQSSAVACESRLSSGVAKDPARGRGASRTAGSGGARVPLSLPAARGSRARTGADGASARGKRGARGTRAARTEALARASPDGSEPCFRECVFLTPARARTRLRTPRTCHVRFMREIPREVNLDVLTQGLRYSISGLMNLAANQTSDTTSDAQSNGPYFVNFNQDCT